MTSSRRLVLAMGICLLQASAIQATKPCHASPCQEPSGALARSRCSEAAEWIAVGVVSGVVHHREGPPLSKDFAEFTFTVKSWDKGAGKTGRKIRFQVGWCDTQQELPSDTSVPFRIFGAAPGPHGEPRYLFLEPIGRNERSSTDRIQGMADVARLLEQNRAWAAGRRASDPLFFERLCDIQKPEYL